MFVKYSIHSHTSGRNTFLRPATNVIDADRFVDNIVARELPGRKIVVATLVDDDKVTEIKRYDIDHLRQLHEKQMEKRSILRRRRRGLN